LLWLPAMYLFVFLPDNLSWRGLIQSLGLISMALFMGGLIFLTLKLHPAFPQLFSRGSDFLYPWREVVFEGVWQQTIRNAPTYISYFVAYLSPSLLFLLVAGLFGSHKKRQIHLFFWAAILFLLPILLLGRVVYPRYLFPAAIPLTLGGVLSLEMLLTRVGQTKVGWTPKLLISVLLAVIAANILTHSSQFIGAALTNPNETPFVSADKKQYLTEWSSGHGIEQVASRLKVESGEQSIAIATEGYFGTLPDGLLLYLHRQDVSNIYVEGVGQPISKLPNSFLDRAREFDQVWLLVNSHRLAMELDQARLLDQYCRPMAAPCLQLWDITDIADELN
jgi:hypothetical protein